MKTQILQLEAHDDIISTRDKLGWGQTGRVVLVWPKRGGNSNNARVLHHRLDLVLLQRHSASLGLQIALVTRDADVRYYARQLRIPVFDSVDEAQRAHWRGRRRWALPQPGQAQAQKRLELVAPRLNAPRASHAAPKALHPILRWSLFSLAVLSLLALAASILPEAHITIQPQTRSQEIAFDILASPAQKEANLTGELPAQLASVIVEARGSLPTTGEVQVPEKAATVRVRFSNLTEAPVDIPQGLVISTVPGAGQEAVRFLATEQGRVPAGAGTFISLPVRALVPGRSGNLPAGSLVAIEGPLGLSLSVTNLLPSSGGSELTTSGPAPGDYTRLRDELVETLRQDALRDLHSALSPGDLVITPTLQMVETLEEAYSPPFTPTPPSSPASQLGLFLRLRFDAMVIPGKDLSSISARILDAGLPQGFTPVYHSLEIVPFGIPLIERSPGGEAQKALPPVVRWRVSAHRKIQAKVDADRLAALVHGLTASQTIQFIESWLPVENTPIVSITPAWWPRLPLLPTRISVTIPE